MAKGDRIEDVLEGRISQINHCKYYRSIIPVSKVHNPVADRIRRNLNAWHSGKIQNKANADFYIPLQDVVFIDIETRGLKYKNQTFLNGLAYYSQSRGEFVFDGLFARDPYEEEAIMNAFAHLTKSTKGIITFNGTFDLSRLENRFLTYLRNWKWPRDKHLDMYHAITKYNKATGFTGRKLTEYEVAIFRFKREEDDVAGENIPKAYTRYQNGGDPEPLARVVKHNCLDIFTTAAIYIYLLRNPSHFNESLLENLNF
ncbi:ribonuclease H-like domain-containing protein [Candidatus Woesearchaeota archaeon]|nr:ribonuclease H-like domain-containing protein [Candidatus Woesearchaeota archaeon]MBW2994027.1 ribonuclease H-like domain-containing protein [Candidatus Woesearchaeota archaeon]